VPARDELRRAFSRWGLPERIRVDNGVPWGSDDGLPPDLACWLIGLGITVVWNPPYRPQRNGVVERSQGVAKGWVETRTCASAGELQQRLAVADRRQREAYPYDEGRSRLDAHPGLAHSGRLYEPRAEAATWDVRRLRDHLAEYVIRRKVDPQGKIRVYNTPRFIGREWVGRFVWVTFDPEESVWVVQAERGQELRRVPAPEVTAEVIRDLRMTYRTPGRPAPCVGPVSPADDEALDRG
jgi:hypothetical protein